MTPSGLYEFEEESTREIKPKEGDEERPLVIPTVNDMSDITNWLHLNPSILNQGRVKHQEPKSEDPEADPEQLMAAEVVKDPWEPRLKPVTDDQLTRGSLPPWIVRAYDSESTYDDPKTKGATTLNYGTVVIRSLWWPGSFTFYNNGRTQ